MTVTIEEYAAAVALIREEVRRHAPLHLYAIQAGEGGPIKIGLTLNPRQRIKTLQTANAAELRIVAACRAFPEMERDLHQRFAHACIRGEWFEPIPELLELLEAYDTWHLPSER